MSDDFDSPLVWVVTFIAACALAGGVMYSFHACSVADQATLGLAEQDVRTRNYERSEAFRAGTRRDFDELYLAYVRAKSDDEKGAILGVIRQRAEGCPPDQVPDKIRELLRNHTGS